MGVRRARTDNGLALLLSTDHQATLRRPGACNMRLQKQMKGFTME
jgi:hypothetical protein